MQSQVKIAMNHPECGIKIIGGRGSRQKRE